MTRRSSDAFNSFANCLNLMLTLVCFSTTFVSPTVGYPMIVFFLSQACEVKDFWQPLNHPIRKELTKIGSSN